MTYEEAIKHLQNLKFKFMDEYVDYDNTAEAFQHGIEALKKQIPKTPLKIEKFELCDFLIFMGEATKKQIPTKPINSFIKNGQICPSCQEYTERASKYCSHCGQALKWSDEEWTAELTYSQITIKENAEQNPSSAVWRSEYFMCGRRSVRKLVEKAQAEADKLLREFKAFYAGDIGIRIEPKEHDLCWSITATLTVNGEDVKTEDPCDLLFLELNELMLQRMHESEVEK